MSERSYSDSVYPLPCPICHSTEIGTFERDEGLFVVSCENDDCVFGVQTVGGSLKEAIARWNTRVSLQPATPTAGEDLSRYVPDIVKNAMLTMWNYICDDTKCHPLDITHGKGKYLVFKPGHWAQFTGEMVQRNLRDLYATGGDAVAGDAKAALEPFIEAALRHADGLTAQLDKLEWRPSRAHVEQARNTIRKLSDKVRVALRADVAGDVQAARTPEQIVGEQELVAWEWQTDGGGWTPTEPPSEDELKTAPHKFRPLYLGRMPAPACHDSHNSGESDPDVNRDCAGAGTPDPSLVQTLRKQITAHEQLQARIAQALGRETWQGDLADAVASALAQPSRITGARNQIEAAACLIWSELCPGMVMGDDDLPHYEAAAKAVLALTSSNPETPHD